MRFRSLLLTSAFVVGTLSLAVCASPTEGTESGDCRDGADNDRDGFFDCDDDGCAGSPDCEEADVDTDTDADTDSDAETFGPSADCLRYLQCTAAVDPDNQALYEATYGEGADCWREADDALACTQACQVGLEAAHMADPGVEACWPGDTPDMLNVFGVPEDWEWDLVAGSDFICEKYLYRLETNFSATASGPEFVMDPGLIYDDDPVDDFSCTESGWTFACDPQFLDSHTATFSGAFADGFASGTLDFSWDPEDGGFTCTYVGAPF